MVRGHLKRACCVLAAAALLGAAPPGSVVQSQTAYLTGEGMNSAWRVVVSRKALGVESGGNLAYQWYVSFYAPSAGAPKLVYQLPRDGNAILAKVEKARGAPLYFPRAEVRIVGAAELEHSGVQDVVLALHQSGADCGSAAIVVFGADREGDVVPRLQVQNGCDLHAAIVKNGALPAIRLRGPYYGPNAALCCPTRAHASSLLVYRGGKWLLTPPYFSIRRSTRPR